ncbi:MAG: hypothetical protein H7A42_09930 [Chlamydiales bacterium]|nr:hypothetical protein [Chlamydiales bacterium]
MTLSTTSVFKFIEIEKCSFSPLINSNGYSKKLWQNFLNSKEKLLFFANLLLKTIESYCLGKYTDFDAHTSTNCCHGMAVFVRDLILALKRHDLVSCNRRILLVLELLNNSSTFDMDCFEWTPGCLIDLASLYALSLANVQTVRKGIISDNLMLKKIAQISNSACETIGRGLQKKFSNLIASSYESYLDVLDVNMKIAGASVRLWGKYIKNEYLRLDKRQRKYASSMFSMQVSFAYLIHSCAKVALVNDLVSEAGQIKGRYVKVFCGNGVDSLIPLTLSDMNKCDSEEPLVVFGACAINEDLDLDVLEMRMNQWLYQFPELVLAHEIHYPQFPQAKFDPDFDNTPIYPCDPELRESIEKLSSVAGVDARNPSFCCFTHIFPASVGQIMKVLQGVDEDELPYSYRYLPSKIFLN